MSAGKFFMAFFIGAAAGATLALIYAPQSGAKTRRQLRRGIEDAGAYVKDAAGTISDQAGRCMKRGKGMVEDAKGTAQSAFGAAKKVVSM
ncbi:MAG: YtxH domain-containing protein [Acidobacteriaceae bacterium]